MIIYVWNLQKLNGCPAEMEMDSIVEDISSLFLDENMELTVEEICLAPWTLEERKSPSKEEAIGIPSDFEISDGENNLCDSVSQVLSPPYVESLDQSDILTENLSETLCLPAVEAVLETKMLQFHTPPDTLSSPSPPGHENSFEKLHSNLPEETEGEYEYTDRDDEGVADALTVPPTLDEKSLAEDVIMPKESKSECTLRDDGSTLDVFTMDSEDMFLPLKEAVLGTIVEKIKSLHIVDIDSPSDVEKKDRYISQSQLLKDNCHDRGHSLNEIAQDVRNKFTGGISPTSRQIESVNVSMTQELVFNIMNTDQTLQSDKEILESCTKAVEKTSTNYNIWSRRGKANRAPQVRTSKSTVKNAANVDTDVAMSKEKDIRNRTISNNLFSELDGEVEDEIFTPDKENFSPNTLQKRSLKKGKAEEIKHSRSLRSRLLSKNTSNCENYPHESIGPVLCKMNQTDIINTTISKDLFSVSYGEKEEEFFTPDKENLSPNTLQLRLLKKKGKVEGIKRSKSKGSPLSMGIFNPDTYPNESIGPLCKMNQTDIINTTISEDLISDLDVEEEESFTPNKENYSPNTLQLRLQKNMGNVEEIKSFKSQKSPLSIDPAYDKLYQNDTINSSISKDLFSDLAGEEEDGEIFTPDKENFSPNALQLRLLKKKSKVAEISPWKENKKLQRKPFCSQINLAQEQHLMTSKDREERVPFQSLNSSGDMGKSNTVYPVSAAKSFHFSNCGQILDQHSNHRSVSFHGKI